MANINNNGHFRSKDFAAIMNLELQLQFISDLTRNT